jgi:hypothetical protein
MKAFQIFLTVAVLGGIGNMAVEAKAQNPIVGGGSQTDVYYDPFNDHTYVKRERISVRESAFDPGRMYVDPGSKRYIDRYFRDNNGQLVREFGWTWTSNGRPHGKLTRQRVRRYSNPRPGCNGPGSGGGVTIDDQDTVVFSVGGNKRRPNNNRRPKYNGRPGNNRRPGGTTIDDRKTVIFDANSRNKNNRNRNNNNRNNNRKRTGQNKSRNGRPAMFGSIR